MSLPQLHHTGFVVTDLESSVAFYKEHFGAEVELFSEAVGDDVAKLHGLEGEADFTLAVLRIGDGRLELLEFRTPADGEVPAIRGCDVGSFHVAIQVDDIDVKYRELVDAGIAFTRRCTRTRSHPRSGRADRGAPLPRRRRRCPRGP